MANEKTCGSYDVLREGDDVTLRIECETCTFFPSIEDDGRTMALTVDSLAEAGLVNKIVFVQKRDYEYDNAQVILLQEIASLYKQIVQNKPGYTLLVDSSGKRYLDAKYAEVQDILHRLLKSDPVAAYVELVRVYRREDILLKEGSLPPDGKTAITKLVKFLQDLLNAIEQLKIIKLAKPHLSGFKIGDRDIYRKWFSPSIKPDFMFTKLQASYPPDAEELASYEIAGTEVTIFSLPGSVQYLYHIVPPEFKLSEEQYELLDAARKIMAEHKPKKTEFVDPARMREVFTAIGADLVDELSSYRGLHLRDKERDELVQILVRYTVGFGLIEVLLSDERVQDISINSPLGRAPIFIVHQDFGDCTTNIVPTISEAESWASKLRLISGRPLDEANPILDTELILPNARARVAAITAPLNPTGLAYSFRRHRDKPWTLSLFVSNGMISPLAAGVLSFLVDGARTMLVAGTRSSGKTSLLGAVMVEIMRRIRIITIEDTLELPVTALKDLNYNIQSMKVASALTRGTT
ncbi:MAG: ATPase, T2SS/T4P/T4SS family, partial [Nanoarchaeota archaeon]